MNLLKYTMCASTVPYRLPYLLILCHLLLIVVTAAQYPDDSKSFVTNNGENVAQVSIDSSDASPNHKNSNVADVGFVHAFIASFSVIIVSELGDKTFFIAAIMAMRNPRLTVFAGAILALALMTVLSVVFGLAAHIIPRVYTYYISTALFAIFGLKMLKDGCSMRDQDQEDELEDVQSDLKKREDEYLKSLQSGNASAKSCSIELLPIATDDNASNDNNNNKSREILEPNENIPENGPTSNGHVRQHSSQQAFVLDVDAKSCSQLQPSDNEKMATAKCTINCESSNGLCNRKVSDSGIQALGSQTIGVNGSLQRLEKESSLIDAESGIVRKTTVRKGNSLMARIFMQAFTMTFVAEWGDRSQLTTIILGARENAYGVVIGGVIGHAICTGLAVIGGKMIAKKISVRTVTILGGFVFLIFALSSLFFNPNDDEPTP